MLVFDDRAFIREPRRMLQELAAAMWRIASMGAGPSRHDRLVGLFLEAAALVQGLADEAFERQGEDDDTPLGQAGIRLLLQLSSLVMGSWDSGYARMGRLPRQALAALGAFSLPKAINCREPEGFAHYAVYPEAHGLAARRHAWSGPPLFLGLRSIGLALGASAHAGAGGAGLLSLRPTGDPFARALRPSRRLLERLAAHNGDFAIVDEGPGLSGSSFFAALNLLDRLGVEPGRIVCMPTHLAGPGAQAPAHIRARLDRTQKVTMDLDGLLETRPIGARFADLTGPVSCVEDLSGGAWRSLEGKDPAAPAWPRMERRKFRLTGPEGRYTVRFAGLGRKGEERFEVARRLAEGGFVPEPLALRGGLILSRWVEGSPLWPGVHRDRAARDRFVGHLGRYLAYRARTLEAPGDVGADFSCLKRMTIRNGGLLLGEGFADGVRAWLEWQADDLPQEPRVRIDGRLHAFEWVRAGDGRIWKMDAFDHSGAHDLVGCQEIGWDLAGATVEFDLEPQEAGRLVQAVEQATGRPLAQRRLQVLEVFYCAFQAGLWAMAAAESQERQAGERSSRYAHRLKRLVAGKAT